MAKKLVFWLAILLCGAPYVYGQKNSALLNTLFDSLYQKQGFNGCVLITDSGQIIFEKSYGYANFDKKIPLTLNTGFELASISKQFTAMAIMQLHSQGKLNYSDPITRYLPDLPYPNVTIDDLIHHCSGIGDFLGWTSEQMGDTRSVYSNSDIERRLPALDPVLHFEPGSKYSYSNTNYVILADIVSKVSGIPFPVYVQNHIFDPAGMTKTCIPRGNYARFKPGDYALNYLWDPVTGKFMEANTLNPNNYCYRMGGVYGPYGIQSTVGDLYKWTQAIRNNTLVPDSVFTAAMKPKLSTNGKDVIGPNHMPYAFGWILNPKSYKDPFIWHSGGFGGYRTLIVFYPRSNRTIVILENTDRAANLYAIMVPITKVMDGAKSFDLPIVKKPPKAIPVSSNYLRQLTGIYTQKDNSTIRMVITAKGNRLYAKYLDQVAAEIYPSATDKFFYMIVDAQIHFEQQDGKYMGLTLFQNGGKLHLLKRQ